MSLVTEFILFFAATFGLVLGPILDTLAHARSNLRNAMDGLLSGLLLGLVGLEILPLSLEVAGVRAAAFALVGFLGPVWVERMMRVGGPAIHTAALGGLLVHAIVDGVALTHSAPDHGSNAWALAMAIIVHRVPIGLVVWRLAGRTAKWRAVLTLTLLSVATFLGLTLGLPHNIAHQSVSFACFQALVGGMLLHVVFESVLSSVPHTAHHHHGHTGHHHHAHGETCQHTHHHHPKSRWGATIEATAFLFGLTGIALVLGFSEHSSLYTGLGTRFMGLWLESSPALVLGFVSAGLLSSFLPSAPIRWVQRGNRLSQSIRGVVFGLPIPICSCGVVPVYRSLLQRKLPIPAALAFLISAPELGLESVLLTIPLLGAQFAVVRVIAAAALAVFVGFVVGSFASTSLASSHSDTQTASETSLGLSERFRRATHYAFVEVVEDVAVWILIGLLIAAAVPPDSLLSGLTQVPASLHVPLAAALGVPMYVCASGATPIAAALVAAGLSPGAGLAFLLSGPSTNMTTFGVLKRFHGQATAVAFGALIIVSASLLGWGLDQFIPSLPSPGPIRHPEHFSGFAWVTGVFVAGLFIAALFRRGPRALAGFGH